MNSLNNGYQRHNKSWKLLILTLGVCVVLSACGNKITSEQAKQEEKQATEQASSQKEGKEQKGKEQNSSSGDIAVVTPDRFIDTLMNGSKDAIYNQFTPDMKKAVSLEDFKTSSDSFMKGVKSWKQVVEANMNGLTEYAWMDETETKGIRAYFTEDHQIGSMAIVPLEAHEDTDSKFTKTEFEFPMKGGAYVFWGGTNVLSNYHYEHATQRYALDVVRTKGNASYQGDSKVNESYYAFGEPLYAAADGTVVEIKNDIADNIPGDLNPKEAAGNYVVIDHGNGEYSFTVHMKKGTVAVKKGDQLKQGDLIGELGNSGNSSEAHLHFQVSDGPDLFTSRSINIRWADQSQPLTRGHLVQGKQ